MIRNSVKKTSKNDFNSITTKHFLYKTPGSPHIRATDRWEYNSDSNILWNPKTKRLKIIIKN